VQKLLAKAVKAASPAYADVTVTFVHGADPVVVDVESPPIELLSRAFKEVEGRGVVPVRSGGSIPIVPELGKAGAPVILSGIGLPDDRLHAPDEKLNVEQIWKGVRVFGRFFQLMGDA
jgi:amidohydrolase